MRTAAAVELSPEQRTSPGADGASTFAARAGCGAGADRAAGRGRSGEQADRPADEDDAGEGGALAEPLSGRRHRGSGKGRAAAGPHAHHHRAAGEASGGYDAAQKPANATHWSTRTMARAAGISEASVRRIWRAHGLKPHQVRTFKLSRDPAVPGEAGGHRRPVSESARARHRAVRRREEPDSGSGPHPARPADEERPLRHHDPRLQAQRNGHAVCRPRCARRPGHLHVRRPAPPSGMAEVPARYR